MSILNSWLSGEASGLRPGQTWVQQQRFVLLVCAQAGNLSLSYILEWIVLEGTIKIMQVQLPLTWTGVTFN